MNDQTARLVHWLADGRSAAIVAPALRAATAPGARSARDRARAAGALVEEIDVARARRIVQRLGQDPEFRRSLTVAAGRVRSAVDRSSKRRRGGRVLLAVALVVAAAGAVAAFLRSSPGAVKGSSRRPQRQADGVEVPYDTGVTANR